MRILDAHVVHRQGSVNKMSRLGNIRPANPKSAKSLKKFRWASPEHYYHARDVRPKCSESSNIYDS